MQVLRVRVDSLRKEKRRKKKKITTSISSASPYATIFYNRLLLCVIEIMILWCTSLRVVSTIVRDYIPSPTLAQVGDECSNSYKIIEQQQDSYSMCSRAQTQACFSHLHTQVAHEHARVQNVEVENNRLSWLLQNATRAIFYDYELLVSSLQNWVEANTTIGVTYS